MTIRFWGNFFASYRHEMRIGLDYERKFVHTANDITSEDPSPTKPYAIHVTWLAKEKQLEKFSSVLKRHGLIVDQNRQSYYS